MQNGSSTCSSLVFGFRNHRKIDDHVHITYLLSIFDRIVVQADNVKSTVAN